MRKILGAFLAYCTIAFGYGILATFKEFGFLSLALMPFAVVSGYFSYISFHRSTKKYKMQRAKELKEERRKLEWERYKNEILDNTSLMEEDLDKLELEGYVPITYVDNIILKDSEECRYFTLATRLILKERVVGYKGGSVGLNIKVAKGIGLRTGQSKGNPIRGDITEETLGTLYITDNRLIFMAPKNSFDINIDKIVATEYYSDGIGIQDNKKTYTMNLVAPDIPLSIIKSLIAAKQASV